MGFLFSPSSLLLLGCSILKWSLRHLNGDPISVCSRIFLCLWQKQSHVLLHVFVSKIFFSDIQLFLGWNNILASLMILWMQYFPPFLNFFSLFGPGLVGLIWHQASFSHQFWPVLVHFWKKKFVLGWVESPKSCPKLGRTSQNQRAKFQVRLWPDSVLSAHVGSLQLAELLSRPNQLIIALLAILLP